MISNISNQYTPNFKGSFLIDYTRAVKGTREYMETIALNNHKQIFPNWNGNPNCVFYITRDKKDFQVAEAIYRNGLKAKYFPNITTKNGFDADFPEQVQAYVALLPRTEFIAGCKRILNYVTENRPHGRTKINPSQKAPKANIYETIKNKINPLFDTDRVDLEDGVVSFVDKNPDSKARVLISPPSKRGSRFVQFLDSGPNEVVKYIEYDKNGELVKVYDYRETALFLRNYNDCIHRCKQIRNAKSGK